MTTQQRSAVITRIITKHDRLDYEWDRLIKVVGTHDMPLFEASWAVFDSYVEAIAREIGDEGGWLSWYIHENKCGLVGLSASPGAGVKTKPIRTIAGLVKLIEYRAP
jgi:hypothetical protein